MGAEVVPLYFSIESKVFVFLQEKLFYIVQDRCLMLDALILDGRNSVRHT